MTPERIVALLVSLSPVILMVGGAIAYLINRYDKKQREKHPPLDLNGASPTTGITVEDDHADEAIQALRESRDDWKSRALEAEAKLRQPD